MPADHRRVTDLFAAALGLSDAAARGAFLDRECIGDSDLRRRLDALLDAHDYSTRAPTRPAAATDPTRDFLAEWPELPDTTATTDSPVAGAEIGGRVGPYKLLQQLGEGGMGEVWVAEQEHPVKRRVALKLIKPGMDSARVVARFEAERQALALMDHTNIAKVFDAGMTPAGRPYFAMELIKGVPITKYCDELHLSIRERLGLFVAVCSAVQHAHQKGVIHRDIKPTNVLVAIQDGKPVPKVIDFGVAKALTSKLAERTMYTEIGAVIGTLEYMAPEQAELSALDVDTRADVYALGALLYELLTGSTPITRERVMAAAFIEVLRLIREEDPPKPSTRLTQSKESLAGLASKRRTDPGRLAKEVRGELDWIVLKALEKDRTRRYESASALAKDVERFLVDEPVEACPPSPAYRVRKFLRRNRVAVGAAGAVLAAAVLAAVGQTVNVLAAREAERRAVTAEHQAVADRERADAARLMAERDRDRARIAEGEQAKARAHAEEAKSVADSARTLADAERAKADAERKVAEAERDAKQAALVHRDGLRLGSEAVLARPNDPGLALLLGLEAVRRYPHPLTYSSLYDAAADLHEKRSISTDVTNQHLRLGTDGKQLLAATSMTYTGQNVGTATVYDTATGKKRAHWQGCGHGVRDLDWSADGSRVVVAPYSQVSVRFTDGGKPERAVFTERVAYIWDAATGKDLVHLRRHDDKVVSVRFTPDGTKVITASDDRTARIWDAETGKELHVLRGHKLSLLVALVSPDGKRVLTVSSQEERGGHYQNLSEKPGGPAIDPGMSNRPWASEGSSGGGSTSSTTHEAPLARLWDIETGREVGALTLDEGGLFSGPNYHQPRVAAFSPDGKRVVIGFSGDLIGVWDAAGGGAPLRTFRGFGGNVSVLAFNPDSTRLAAAGDRYATGGDRGAVVVWDYETGQELRRLLGPDAKVNTLTFMKTGSRLVAAADDRTARVWDVDTGRQIAVLRGHAGAARAALFLDPDALVTADDRGLRFFAVPAPPPVSTLLTGDPPNEFFGRVFGRKAVVGHRAGLTALAFSPDGTTILTGSQDYTAKLWDAVTGRPVATSDPLRGQVTGAAFSPDGKAAYIATTLNTLNSAERGDKATLLSMVHRWEPATGKAVRFLKDQDAAVGQMTLSQDGKRITLVNHWSRLAFRPTKSDPLHYEFSPQNESGAVGVWDIAKGHRLSTIRKGKSYYEAIPLQFSPDGQIVLLADEQRMNLELYDAETGAKVRALPVPKDYAYGQWATAQFSPDGRTIVGQRAWSGVVWFWAADTGALIGKFEVREGNSGGVMALGFTPDSKRLAVAADRLVHVVDVATRIRERVLRGHEERLTALAFSKEGERLLTGSEDRSAILWEMATGRILAVYKGHPGPVQLVAYSPDGTRVATGSTDPLARVWPVNLLPEFEKRKPRELTPQERDRYELPAPPAGLPW